MKYQILGNTGVRVSSVALGTANFGMRWGYGASLDESRAILDAFAEDGGNFIDTADVYQFGESEEFLGALLQGRRENFFLATKYS
ncbi:aldo/keto reductase, partial [Escherichia coli]